MDRSVRGVHNSLEIFYLPGLKQYSIYSFVLFDFRVFQYFSRPVSKIGKTWLWQGRKTCKKLRVLKIFQLFFIFSKIIFENVRYSIYSRTNIYIYNYIYMIYICVRVHTYASGQRVSHLRVFILSCFTNWMISQRIFSPAFWVEILELVKRLEGKTIVIDWSQGLEKVVQSHSHTRHVWCVCFVPILKRAERLPENWAFFLPWYAATRPRKAATPLSFRCKLLVTSCTAKVNIILIH